MLFREEPSAVEPLERISYRSWTDYARGLEQRNRDRRGCSASYLTIAAAARHLVQEILPLQGEMLVLREWREAMEAAAERLAA